MSPSQLYRVGGGGYYLTDYDSRAKTPAYFSRSYWEGLSSDTKPFVKIEELDSGTGGVISRKNYSYTPSSALVLASPLSSRLYSTTLSDYYPYYRIGTSLWETDPLLYSRSLLSYPLYSSGLYSGMFGGYWPRTSWRRSFHYPTHYDSAFYISRLLPYYYYPRPVYHSTYSPSFHYHYDPPRTSISRTTRTYYVPPAISYQYTPSTYHYAYSSSSNYLL